MASTSTNVEGRSSKSPSTSPLSDHWDVNAIAKPSPTVVDAKVPIMSSTSTALAHDPLPRTTHTRSASTSHRRRQSSISISLPHPTASSLRTSNGPSDYSTLQSRINPDVPLSTDDPIYSAGRPGLGLMADPAFSLEHSRTHPDTQDVSTPDFDPRMEEVAHGRMASFTFGSKAPSQSNPLLPPTARRRARPSSIIHTPRSSTSTSELSRPPSLVVTSPLMPAELNNILDTSLAPTHEPPLPLSSSSRNRKHSHTRSNSISLPNLKLGRPTSLTASASLTSSFPSSPISPDSDSTSQPSRVITSRRLKFEPSGRGAEAELAKEESRRKALEKLTGVSQIPDPRQDANDSNVESIVLPSIDLEISGSDVLSTSPHLGFGSERTPESLPLLDPTSDFATRSPRLSSASSNVTSPHLYGQSTLSRLTLPFSRMPKSGGPGSIYENERDIPSVSKRISVTSALGVLQEEDENESSSSPSQTEVAPARHPLSVSKPAESPTDSHAPPSTGLRQLRLLSPPSDKSTFQNDQISSPNSFSLMSSDVVGGPSHTPTKRSSLSINRHRPQSLHLNSPLAVENTSSPVSASALTHSTRSRQSFGSSTPDRRTSRSGSLSYKKTPSGDATTQRTSDTSVFGDILTPSSAEHERPLHQSTSTNNSHTESNSSALHSSWGSPSPWHHSDVARAGRWSQPTHKIDPTPGPTIDIPLNTRRASTSDSISLNWQGSSLDLALQRDTMEEDRDMWRSRCMAAEAKLEEERRERAILQGRIRKLGDHLSSVSSGPSDSAAFDHSPPEILRQQLYTTTLELERVQHAKSEALAHIAQLEGRVAGLESRALTTTSPPGRYMPQLPSSLFDDSFNTSNDIARGHESSAYAQASIGESSSYEYSMSSRSDPFAQSLPHYESDHPNQHAGLTPVTDHPDTGIDVDTTRHRMKVWGFPGPPRQNTPTKEKDQRRESFFGLSFAPTPPCEREDYGSGVDLPPFFSGHHVPASPDLVTPTPSSTHTTPIPTIALPHVEAADETTLAETSNTLDTLWERYEPDAYVPESTKVNHHDHDLDFTQVCRCCVGQVFVV